ncbi:MAG: hypothetical protein IKV62_06780 [Bacteroidales bacterium]|nr:hypothetical protein [Bacteroidales bacterium]
MRKWEDIIKEKMEEPDGELPESVFAEFHTRFDDAGIKHTAKRFPWVWALIPAVAAGLAAVLLLRKPEITEDGPRQVQQQPVAQIQTEEPIDENFSTDTPQFFGRTAVTKSVPHETISDISEVPAIAEDQAETPESTDSQETTASPKPGTNPSTGNTPTLTTSPYIPLTGAKPRVNIKVAPAAGGILGGGVLAALATYLTDSKKNTIPSYVGHGTVINSPSGQSGNHQGGAISSSVDDPDNIPTDNPQPEEPIKDLLEQSTHYFPIKAGLSTRLPLTERLFLTTGLEYSLYRSKYNMSYSGEKWQRVHYLGIPVRLDWVVASHSLFDVYVGGGMQGDFCLNASLAGKDIKKDGPSLSLLGVGGIQMNATKRLGLYLEPEFSWMIPNENNTLVTYRSEHPVMFSVSAGIRINLGQ